MVLVVCVQSVIVVLISEVVMTDGVSQRTIDVPTTTPVRPTCSSATDFTTVLTTRTKRIARHQPLRLRPRHIIVNTSLQFVVVTFQIKHVLILNCANVSNYLLRIRWEHIPEYNLGRTCSCACVQQGIFAKVLGCSVPEQKSARQPRGLEQNSIIAQAHLYAVDG